MRQSRFLVIISPYRTDARFQQISLKDKHTYRVFFGVFAMFSIISVLFVVGCGEILVEHKFQELTKKNRALESQLLSYDSTLDTLFRRIQNYRENLKSYELLVGTANQENEAIVEQPILFADTLDGLTVETLIARVNFLQDFTFNLKQRQKAVEKAVKMKVTELARLPVMLPVEGQINSGFGVRRNPFETGGPGRQMHEGVDIGMPEGEPIRATADGMVVFAGRSDTYGNLVIIDHENGYYTYYAHCSKLLVKVNQRVKRHDIIARVGSTGRSTAPHVHYEVLEKKKPVNPMDLLFRCPWG